MALWIGLPVSRSQISVVSRWLVMPMVAMSEADSEAWSALPNPFPEFVLADEA